MNDVVDLRADLAVRSLDGVGLGALVGPTLGLHSPQALVHVEDRVHVLLLRGRQGGLERFGAFAGRQVFGETGVVGAVVPPVPQHADRRLQMLPHHRRRLQHARRPPAIPHPKPGLGQPGRRELAAQPAAFGDGLGPRRFAIELRRGRPIAAKRSEHDRKGQAELGHLGGLLFRLVQDLEMHSCLPIAPQREFLAVALRIVAGGVEAGAVVLIEGQALHGHDQRITPGQPRALVVLALRQRAGVAGQRPQLSRNGEDFLGAFPQAGDAGKPDLLQPHALRFRDRQLPAAERGVLGAEPDQDFHAQRLLPVGRDLVPHQPQSGLIAGQAFDLGRAGALGRQFVRSLAVADRDLPQPQGLRAVGQLIVAVRQVGPTRRSVPLAGSSPICNLPSAMRTASALAALLSSAAAARADKAQAASDTKEAKRFMVPSAK